MKGDIRDLILPAVLVGLAGIIGYTQLGPLPAIVFTVAFGGGFVLYIFTSWKTPFDTSKVLVPYLLTVAFFIAHVFEEYLTGFEKLVSQISGAEVTQWKFLMVAGFIAPIVWVIGAILIFKQTAIGNYFLCAFFFAMMIAELSHFVFPFLIDGTFHYESGMYTAALPLIPASYGFFVMMKEIARARQIHG